MDKSWKSKPQTYTCTYSKIPTAQNAYSSQTPTKCRSQQKETDKMCKRNTTVSTIQTVILDWVSCNATYCFHWPYFSPHHNFTRQTLALYLLQPQGIKDKFQTLHFISQQLSRNKSFENISCTCFLFELISFLALSPWWVIIGIKSFYYGLSVYSTITLHPPCKMYAKIKYIPSNSCYQRKITVKQNPPCCWRNILFVVCNKFFLSLSPLLKTARFLLKKQT